MSELGWTTRSFTDPSSQRGPVRSPRRMLSQGEISEDRGLVHPTAAERPSGTAAQRGRYVELSDPEGRQDGGCCSYGE
jgi:hypothetical protein